ncbi:MAG: MogA/MoaB family molybdenum cofactor biosynthesis protein [Planctomycetota bacterium]
MTPPAAPEPDNCSSQHHASDASAVACAVITVSDTRTEADDRGGQTLVELLEEAGHQVVAKHIVPDEPAEIRSLLETLINDGSVSAVLLTGGTGISQRDQTCETVASLLTKPLPGYGELLRMLSYQEIGAKAMLSRAVGGVAGQTVVLTMPGSPAAVRLAMQQVILPTLGHLVREATK